MNFVLISLLIQLLLPFRAAPIQCLVGYSIKKNGVLEAVETEERVCSESCLTTEAEVEAENSRYSYLLEQCHLSCAKDRDLGCRQLKDYFESRNESVIISSCNPSCCDGENFCNLKPVVPDLFSTSEEDPHQKNDERTGRRLCLFGSQETIDNRLVYDDVRAITCSRSTEPEMLCHAARIVAYSEGGDVSVTNAYECRSSSKCTTSGCDIMINNVPTEFRSRIISCSSYCCEGDMCNSASRKRASPFLFYIAISLLLLVTQTD